MGPKIYCFLLRFSVFGWFMNSDVGPSKNENAKSLLGMRMLTIHDLILQSTIPPTFNDPM